MPLGLEGMSIGARGPALGTSPTLLTSWPDRQDRTGRAAAGPVPSVPDADRRVPSSDGMPELIEAGTIYDANIPALNGVFSARSLAADVLGAGHRRGRRRRPVHLCAHVAPRHRGAHHRPRRDPRLPDAVAARVPHGRHEPRRARQRVRSLRPRWLRCVGRSVERPRRGHGLQPDGRDARRRPAPVEGGRRRGQVRPTRWPADPARATL